MARSRSCAAGQAPAAEGEEEALWPAEGRLARTADSSEEEDDDDNDGGGPDAEEASAEETQWAAVSTARSEISDPPQNPTPEGVECSRTTKGACEAAMANPPTRSCLCVARGWGCMHNALRTALPAKEGDGGCSSPSTRPVGVGKKMEGWARWPNPRALPPLTSPSILPRRSRGVAGANARHMA